MDKNSVEDIIDKMENLSFFSDNDKYMKLHDASMLDINDIYESEMFDILESALKRYNDYLDMIVFTDESLKIKDLLKRYIKKYSDYKIEEYELFKMMKYIDALILDFIHSSEKPKFWMN